MKKLLLVMLVLTVFYNGKIYGSNSNLAAAFREKSVGARPLAMGGAYTAAAADPLALIWNPAALANQPLNNGFVLEYSRTLSFYEDSFIGYSRKLNQDLVLGAGFLHSGDEIMSESTGYLAIAADLWSANRLFTAEVIPQGFASFGLTFKYYYSSYGNNAGADLYDYMHQNHRVSGSAKGFGIDTGLRISLNDQDHLGTSFKNLFSNVSWESENEAGTARGSYTESIPMEWTVGYARTERRWTAAIDINKTLYTDIEDNIYAGVEYFIVETLALRGGYSQELVTADNKKFMAGIAVTLKPPGLPLTSFNFSQVIHNDWLDNRSVLFSMQIPARSYRP